MTASAEQTAFRAGLEVVAAVEPDVAGAIRSELDAQRRQLKLIASENYASPAVLLAMGNWFSDKYAEGVPGRRMYAGCEQVDRVERIAAGHAIALFGSDHAYVQPHSGIDANLVAFWAILARRVERPFLDAKTISHVNDLSSQDWAELRTRLGAQRMLGMSLDAGGHLTHGFRPNISGKMFRPGGLRRRPRNRAHRLRRPGSPGPPVSPPHPPGRLLRLSPEPQLPGSP